MTYVPLGIRTEYSFQDGMCRIEPLVERARALRLGAIGIADMHSAFAFLPFYRAARAAGVRPILGVTVRVQADVDAQSSWGEEPAEIKLFARDATGYRHLLQLLSRASLENGVVPVTHFQDLERFAAGVLALDGGLGGPVARSLARGERDGAENVAARLREIYGADGFYMEVQRHGGEARLDPFLIHLAQRLNVPLVAGCDARYLEPADAEAHAVLRCIGEGTAIANDPSPVASGEPHLLRSETEMRQAFRDLPEALANTCVVAERCQLELEAPGALTHRTRSGREPLAELRHEIERGLRERLDFSSMDELPVAVRDRLAHELAMIEEMELASCFLIAQGVVRTAKEEGISLGPGRGAAAGSLVSHLLGITRIDPLEHGLLFERFVSRNAGRGLEFEFDVEHRRRDALAARVWSELGETRAALAASLSTLSTRSVVREAAQALGFEPAEVDELARSLYSEGASDLWQALDRSHALKRAYQDDVRVRRLLDIARRLEGLPRNPTLQAGGLLVAPGRMTDHAALQRARSGECFAQLTAESAAAIGMLRLELHASRGLTVLANATALVRERKGTVRSIETLPLDDAPTFQLIAAGDTFGVPQFEGQNVQALGRAMAPERFEELVATLCLARPGARSAGLAERYLERRSRAQSIEIADPRLGPIVGPTFGLFLYQEQVIEAAIAVAGYERDEAESLREALQKRRIGDLARQRARFLRGAVERGVELERAEDIFGTLLRFANFDFDKSHGVGAALLGYASAYLHAHHPVEFWAALLDESYGQGQRFRDALLGAMASGIEIRPVDVNESDSGTTIEGDAIRLGLECVRRLGEEGAARVVAARASKRFHSLEDVLGRIGDLPESALLNLARAGAFAGLDVGRAEAVQAIEAGGASSASTPTEQLELAFLPSVPRHAGGRAGIPVEYDVETLRTLEREAMDASLAELQQQVRETASGAQSVLRFPTHARHGEKHDVERSLAMSHGNPPEPNAEGRAGSPPRWGIAGGSRYARRGRSALRSGRAPARRANGENSAGGRRDKAS